MKARAAGAALLAPAALALLFAGSCGPGEEKDPVGAATRHWDGLRRDVDRLRTARGAARDEPRRLVCYRLSSEVRGDLQAQARGGGLPDCPFLDRVALLNGTTQLSPLRSPTLDGPPGGPAVTGKVAALRGNRREVLTVVVQEQNPGNWQVVRLGDAGVTGSEASR